VNPKVSLAALASAWNILRQLCFGALARSPGLPRNIRARLHAAAGADISRTATFGPRVFVRDYRHLVVGDQTWIGPECYFESHAEVAIGNQVNIAARCVFATASHNIGPAKRRAGSFFASKIEVQDGAWVGAGAIILPGVTIGSGCIVAAGSVVISDCEANGLYAGVPAQRKRDLP
jgi:maltose O-acetyltransferase